MAPSEGDAPLAEDLLWSEVLSTFLEPPSSRGLSPSADAPVSEWSRPLVAKSFCRHQHRECAEDVHVANDLFKGEAFGRLRRPGYGAQLKGKRPQLLAASSQFGFPGIEFISRANCADVARRRNLAPTLERFPVLKLAGVRPPLGDLDEIDAADAAAAWSNPQKPKVQESISREPRFNLDRPWLPAANRRPRLLERQVGGLCEASDEEHYHASAPSNRHSGPAPPSRVKTAPGEAPTLKIPDWNPQHKHEKPAEKEEPEKSLKSKLKDKLRQQMDQRDVVQELTSEARRRRTRSSDSEKLSFTSMRRPAGAPRFHRRRACGACTTRTDSAVKPPDARTVDHCTRLSQDSKSSRLYRVTTCRRQESTEGRPFAACLLHEVVHHWAQGAHELATFSPGKELERFGLSFLRVEGLEKSIAYGKHSRTAVHSHLDKVQASWLNDSDLSRMDKKGEATRRVFDQELQTLLDGGRAAGEVPDALQIWTFRVKEILRCLAPWAPQLSSSIDLTVVHLDQRTTELPVLPGVKVVSVENTKLAVRRFLQRRLRVSIGIHLELPSTLGTPVEWKMEAYQMESNPCKIIPCTGTPTVLLVPGQHEAPTARVPSVSEFQFRRLVRIAGRRSSRQPGSQGQRHCALACILETRDDGTPQRLMQVRNPWGHKDSWRNWGDDSELWSQNPQLHERMKTKMAGGNDGKFFMSLEDWGKSFNALTVCPIGERTLETGGTTHDLPGKSLEEVKTDVPEVCDTLRPRNMGGATDRPSLAQLAPMLCLGRRATSRDDPRLARRANHHRGGGATPGGWELRIQLLTIFGYLQTFMWHVGCVRHAEGVRYVRTDNSDERPWWMHFRVYVLATFFLLSLPYRCIFFRECQKITWEVLKHISHRPITLWTAPPQHRRALRRDFASQAYRAVRAELDEGGAGASTPGLASTGAFAGPTSLTVERVETEADVASGVPWYWKNRDLSQGFDEKINLSPGDCQKVNRYEAEVAQESFLRYFPTKNGNPWSNEKILEALADFGLKAQSRTEKIALNTVLTENEENTFGFNAFCSLIEEARCKLRASRTHQVFQVFKYADKEDLGALNVDAVMKCLQDRCLRTRSVGGFWTFRLRDDGTRPVRW
eukprot:g31704.t1